MIKSRIYTLFIFATATALFLTACGGNQDTQSVIQTSVAETVAAQGPTEVSVTDTPSTTLIPTQTPYALPTLVTPTLISTLPSSTGSKAECAKASLKDESVVDGQIFKPGEQFTKTWYITNTSNCTWDTTYKIVFWNGDILGGGYVYNLPQITGPGQTVPIALILTAPTTAGTYHSEWKLQTPDNINFGVGMYQSAFYTEIVVSTEETPTYGIVSGNLTITRDPQYGCEPANIVFTAHVTITVNGPLEFKYQIRQQDENDAYKKTVKLTEAGTYTDSDHVWKLGRAASQNSNRWMQLVIVDPVYKEYPKVGFTFDCP